MRQLRKQYEVTQSNFVIDRMSPSVLMAGKIYSQGAYNSLTVQLMA